MVYSYLLDLYHALEQREQDIKTRMGAPGTSPENEQFLQGRLAALQDLTGFLRSNFHHKLPKRMQKI